jgi:hypothetical protein
VTSWLGYGDVMRQNPHRTLCQRFPSPLPPSSPSPPPSPPVLFPTRLPSWHRCEALAFSSSGEEFAGIGNNGVVAVWRVHSSGSGAVDADGNIFADWCRQASGAPFAQPGAAIGGRCMPCSTSQGATQYRMEGSHTTTSLLQGVGRVGHAVQWVAGGVAVGGVGGEGGGEIRLWDASAPPSAGCIAGLKHHKVGIAVVFVFVCYCACGGCCNQWMCMFHNAWVHE